MRVAVLVWVFVVSVSAQTLSSAVPAEIQVLLTTHDYPKAEQAIKEKLAASPAWHTGHVLLAQIYNATGRYELAERSGLAAVKLRESVDALLALAMATLNQRKLNDSIEWLDKAAKRQPGNPEIYKILGLDYAMGGMLRESGQAFQRAVKLAPDNWELHYLDGRALYELEKFPDSEIALERAIERNPASVKAWTALGQVKDRLGDAASSEQTYQKAVDLCGGASRDCAWPLLELGFLASQLDAACAQLEDAARLEPDQSQHQYQLAQVYRRLGNVEKAEQHLARYRELVELERNKKTPAEFNVP